MYIHLHFVIDVYTNSLRVSTPFQELQNNTTYFLTEYSKLKKKNTNEKYTPGFLCKADLFLYGPDPFSAKVDLKC